jgi:Ser/Thr protein kinase RdoA (MazF antagonist)
MSTPIKQKPKIQTIEKLLGKYELDKIKQIKPFDTSGNITYLVKSTKNNYLLRLSPSGFRWRSKREIEAELEIINYLRKNNFPTPVPIVAKDGRQIISWENHFGYLREFVNAKPKLNPTIEEIKRFGETLGQFHSLIESYKTKQKRTHIWDLEETKKNFLQDKKMILKSTFEQKDEFVNKFENEIFSLDFPNALPSGTIHEDLGKRHVFWAKDKIIGIIDFDRSYYGKLVLDLGQACRGWCFTNDSKTWKNDAFQVLMDGYQNQRKPTHSEKKYLVDAIKFSVLERSLSFCLRFIDITNNPRDGEYSRFLVQKNGPLGKIESNRNIIERYIKIV